MRLANYVKRRGRHAVHVHLNLLSHLTSVTPSAAAHNHTRVCPGTICTKAMQVYMPAWILELLGRHDHSAPGFHHPTSSLSAHCNLWPPPPVVLQPTCRMLVDEVDAALVQLKHEGPLAQRIALSHSLHSARQVAPRQGCVQAVHATCMGASRKVSKPWVVRRPGP